MYVTAPQAALYTSQYVLLHKVSMPITYNNTRSSANAENGLDAFSGQSRSITMALFFLDIQCRKMS